MCKWNFGEVIVPNSSRNLAERIFGEMIFMELSTYSLHKPFKNALILF